MNQHNSEALKADIIEAFRDLSREGKLAMLDALRAQIKQDASRRPAQPTSPL